MRKNEYIRVVVSQGASRFLYIITNVALFIIIARWFGPEILGHYSYVIAFLSIGIAVTDFGTTTILATEFPRHWPDDAPVFLGVYLTARAILAVASVVLLIVLSLLLAPSQQMAIMASALALPVLGARFFDPIFQVFGRPAYSLYLSGAHLFAVGISLPLLVIPDIAVLPMLLGIYIAGGVAYSGMGFALLLRRVQPHFSKSWRMALGTLRAAAPIGAAGLLAMLNARMGTLLLEEFAGPREVGLYNAAYRFFDLGVALSVTLSAPLIPVFSRIAIQDPHELLPAYRMVLQDLLIVFLPLGLLVPHISEPVLVLLYGAPYAGAAGALNLLAWCFILLVLAQAIFATLVALGKSGFIYWSAAFGCAAGYGLGVWLVPIYGVDGAAFAALASEMLMAIITLGYAYAKIGSPTGVRNLARILASAGVLLMVLELTPLDNPLILAVLAAAIYVASLVLLRIFPTGALRLLGAPSSLTAP